MKSVRSGFALSLPLGLGCSRLGSVLGPGEGAARALVASALDHGITFFDTAAIYAQGDSEHLLGSVLGQRRDCIICSKVGQHLPLPNPALVPIKRLARMAAARSITARRVVAKVRAQPLPRNWTPAFLHDAVEASLKRLGREQVDIMLLHSPSRPVLTQGEAVGALEAARHAGKIGNVGVSVDDVTSAQAALDDERVRVLQIPLLPNEMEFEAVIERAALAGVVVIAREVFGGSRAISGEIQPAGFAAARIAELSARPDLAVTLIGTTNEAHLRDAVRLFAQGRGTKPHPTLAKAQLEQAPELSFKMA